MPLVVYKSSAGSGKTTTLVSEYLKIALRSPHDFKHILAITFTNNAANEMKERILLSLQKLISGNAWDDGELKAVIEDLGFEQETLIEKAGALQQLIIHRYDEFAVSTIDSFIHRIIRTFATDVQLPHNFEVVIDNDDIVPDIVDELFAKVGSDKDLTEIMVRFVLSQADHEKSYDPGRMIHQFVEKQMGEEGFKFLEKLDELNTSDFLTIIHKLSKKIEALKSIIKSNAKNAIDLIHTNGLEQTDFYQSRSGIYVYFFKSVLLRDDKHLVPNTYVTKTIEEDKWVSGKADPSSIKTIEIIKNELVGYFNNIHDQVGRYFQLSIIHKKIYALALTNEIRSIFMDYTDRTQKVHISEFNKKISHEIADQPVPFIYERLGRKYRYFLIDEFQDTSILQWNNLLPLIEESLSYGHFNMLVGDAKQAIYRFRSGEVELFVNLPELFGADGSPEMTLRQNLLRDNYKEIQLDKNWRSMSEIVRFNNNFFDVIKGKFSDKLREIYKGHKQIVPDIDGKQGGYVSISLLEEAIPEDYAERRLEKIESQVNMLTAVGYAKSDICVLTRTNRSAIEVASFLLEKGYPVLTSESLLLTNSPEVRLIIAFFRLLNQPAEPAYLAEFIQNLLVQRKKTAFHEKYTELKPHLKNGLPEIFKVLGIAIDTQKLVSLPVFEIAENAIRQLNLSHKTNIYLQYFLDFVFESQENGRGAVDTFLELWDKKKEKLYIVMPDGGDAIQLMTIHKAKGLKFESVIVDVTNRGSKKGKTEYWTDVDIEGFDDLKVGLLPISKELDKVGLLHIYQEEDDKTLLDFINMVYVAFTRPVSALMILGHKGGRTKDKFSGLLQQFLETDGSWQEEGDQVFELGQLSKLARKKDVKSVEEVKLDQTISSVWEDQIKVSPADEVYWEAIGSEPARVYGNLIHAILAKIKTVDDIDKALNDYHFAGLIDQSESNDIKTILHKVVEHPALQAAFSKKVIVKNETDLIDLSQKNKVLQRPDRVVINGDKLTVIDYKTGEKEEKHKKQIIQYAKLFSSIGFSKIDQKLVYINRDIEVIEV